MHPRPLTLSSSYAAGFGNVRLLLCLLAAGAGVALVGSLLYLSASLTSAREDLSQAKAQVASLSSQVEVLEARTARIQQAVMAVETASRATRQELRDAYKAHPEWSADTVPVPVRDGLCKRGNCAQRLGPVSAPADRPEHQ